MTIIHKITELYKELYRLGGKIPKRDKFGIFLKIENVLLECLDLAIDAALEKRINKSILLQKLRRKTETLKQLVRLTNELKIFEDKIYLRLELELQEISKMSSGWLKYIMSA